MKFDVILHGKPNAGSHKVTNGLEETFCQNLVDKFFQSMDNIKDAETLIVDARNWKGTWYSVYTFWLGSHITDTADRASYLAISMIFPKQYVCLVSDLYNILRKAYQGFVIGTYISKNGKYLVQDFNDNVAFDKLYSLLENNFVNLVEDFDSSFKTNTDQTSNCYYNLLDCDSKAFVQDLKKYGRIFVSGSYESKDSRLSNTDKYYRELQSKKGELLTKDGQIEQLSKQIKTFEQQIEKISAGENNALKTLETQKAALEKEKDTLNQKLSNIKQKLSQYQENEKQIAKLLTANVTTNIPQTDEQQTNVNAAKKFKGYLLILNTILLIFILFANVFNGCGSAIPQISDSTDTSSLEELKIENQQLKEVLAEKEKQIRGITSSTTSDSYGDVSDDTYYEEPTTDEDCGLTFLQDGKFIEAYQIEATKPLIIKVSRKHNNYSFHSDNLVQSEIVEGEAISLERVRKNKPITIVYRSSNRENKNEKNVIIIK